MNLLSLVSPYKIVIGLLYTITPNSCTITLNHVTYNVLQFLFQFEVCQCNNRVTVLYIWTTSLGQSGRTLVTLYTSVRAISPSNTPFPISDFDKLYKCRLSSQEYSCSTSTAMCLWIIIAQVANHISNHIVLKQCVNCVYSIEIFEITQNQAFKSTSLQKLLMTSSPIFHS